MAKNSASKEYKFRGKIWKYRGKGGWTFITLPKTLSQKIRKSHSLGEREWGRLPALATIKKTSWRTAIWFDTKAGAYLLPVKGAIRQKEDLPVGKLTTVKLEIEKLSWPAGSSIAQGS